MNILITNDDGYNAAGIQALARIMKRYGHITVVAPKYHQSGMASACSMGLKPIAVKKLSESDGEEWYYVDGTPVTCVKFALDEIFTGKKPDLVMSGINHGANSASAVIYSGTLGAAMEATLAGIPGIGVSLDSLSFEADFSAVEEHLPAILDSIIPNLSGRRGIFYNINFPKIKGSEIKGVRVCRQGINHWIKQFEPYTTELFERFGTTPEKMGVHFPEVEEGEKVWVLTGYMEDDRNNPEMADHHMVDKGYISIVAHNIDSTDEIEMERLVNLGIDQDFR